LILAGALLVARASPVAAQSLSAAAQTQAAALIKAWVKMWNTYDLSQVDSLFLADSSVTYFSSERRGLIQGPAALRAHHAGFGFVAGGKAQPNRLWLEQREMRWHGHVAVVLAAWHFHRSGAATTQSGPVTFVLVPRSGQYRLAHAHFANDPSE
jgi:ketosteroid isomerase-like protein